jgi:dTDP-4-dehydrorhamnose reductase
VLGEVVALDLTSSPLCGDLGRHADLAATVRAVMPDVIVNAAAYTAVDKAETDRDMAYSINASAVEVLAREANRLGAWLIHYSTDYVYNGSGSRPWVESDPTGPLNAYGASKLEGDIAAATHCPDRHLILRTSWVFDSWGQNFVKSILRAALQRDSLNVVGDQWGVPTRAALLADVTAHLLRRLDPQLAGTYHLAASGETNWHQYAVLAITQAIECGMPLKVVPARVHSIPASQYPVAAARPGNSRLDTRKLRETFGLVLPPWQDGVRSVVAELAAHRASQ